MRLIKALLLIQFLSVVFLLVKYERGVTEMVAPFLIYDREIYLRSYFWVLMNRVSWCVMLYAIMPNDRYRPYIKLFLFMEIALVIEYILNYNSTWFSVPIDGESFRIGLSHFFIIFKFWIFLHAYHNKR